MSLPSRTTNSWTAAWLSWRASPTRSSSVRAKAAIFWLSIVRSIARILSRRTAARSYSVRSAASDISPWSALTSGLLAALEEQLDLLDVGPVGVLRDRLDARALAALDVVQEARPLEGALALPDVDRAGPEREQAADEVHRLVDARRRGVRPEVAAAVGRQLAGPLDPREVVAQGDLDVRVALVVLEPDVEPRLVALDEVAPRGGAPRETESVSVYSTSATRSMTLRIRWTLAADRLLLPVAPDPAAQVLGLADVEHDAPGVLHEVDAGAGGQLAEGGVELGGHHPMLPPSRPEPRREGRAAAEPGFDRARRSCEIAG